MAESRKALQKVEGQMVGMAEWLDGGGNGRMAGMATYVLFTVHTHRRRRRHRRTLIFYSIEGAMLETMTFWANKEFIAYVATGGVVRFRASKEFRIQLSWHGQKRSRFLLNKEINVTAGFWVIEEFRDFSAVPFFEEQSIQWSFAHQRNCRFLWQT